MTSPSKSIPQAFIWRRLHSLSGIWLVVFITVHLLTNSQAGLFIGDDGIGFIRAVNSIHEMPYLPLIEISVLAFPILIHMLWGIKYLRSAEYNSFGGGGARPYLPEYKENRAYTWQRITSWLLVIGIIAHVIHMRFVEYPVVANNGIQHAYMVRVTQDDGLYTLAPRLGVELYDKAQIPQLMIDIKAQQDESWLTALEHRPLKEGEVIAVANNFGTAELLMLRDTFKIPFMLVLYTLLVLATCFHAFNGLWTFLISWGITLTERSQILMRWISIFLMACVGSLGLAAVWLTYWINLKY